jgi:hypothetical protein
MQNTSATSSAPWWRFGHVWLVLSGPAVVVLASFFTFYLAYVGMDTVVDEDYLSKGAAISQTHGAVTANQAPALQARNHAATALAGKRTP